MNEVGHPSSELSDHLDASKASEMKNVYILTHDPMSVCHDEITA